MNALARELPFEPRRQGGGTPEVTWAEIGARAPVMVATMASYLEQLEVSARPRTVDAAEVTLRLFAHRVTGADPACTCVASIGRPHIEDFKRWLVARRGRTGKPLATMTIRHRLSTVRTFFERIMEWDYEDAPARLFIYMSDFPALDEPLPKFLDDPTAAKFMGRTGTGPQPAPSPHGRAVGPHRHACGRTRRTRRRCNDPQGRRSSPPHSHRQAAQRPLRAPAPHAGRSDYRLQGPARTFTLGTPPRALRWTAFRPAHHPPLRGQRRQAGWSRPRPSPPVAPHARHPVDQPGHEPRGHRCTPSGTARWT